MKLCTINTPTPGHYIDRWPALPRGGVQTHIGCPAQAPFEYKHPCSVMATQLIPPRPLISRHVERGKNRWMHLLMMITINLYIVLLPCPLLRGANYYHRTASAVVAAAVMWYGGRTTDKMQSSSHIIPDSNFRSKLTSPHFSPSTKRSERRRTATRKP